MARQARIKNEYGIFYIHQMGGGNREVFKDNIDRDCFLKILARAQQKYQFKLYAYCLLNSDEYHLVINIDGGDISKIMKSINIAYAMYVSCDTKLFKDRYKSRLIEDEQELKKLIEQIHDRNQDSSLYNSYCAYNGATPITLDFPGGQDNMQQECKDCIKTMQEAENKIKELANKENVTVNELIRDKQRRNDIIRELRKKSTLSLKELGELFGGLTESTICKILNQC